MNGATFAAPGAIGSGTAGTGAFTTLSASSIVSGSGFSSYLASPPAIGGTAQAAGNFTTLQGTTIADHAGNLLVSSTAPTYASGGCTGAAMVTANNTAAFSASVGTSACSGSQPLVFTMPAAPHSWYCTARDVTHPTYIFLQTNAVSTTSVTITNYGPTPGTGVVWVASDVVEVGCKPY